MKFVWLSALFALALAACETVPEITSDVDPNANFQSYATYQWVYQGRPEGMNPLNYDRIHSAIDAQLAAKGYRPADNGDIAIVFTVGSREKIRVTDFGYYGGYYGGFHHGGTSVDQYTEGALAIDVFDARTRRPVWHAQATQRISEGGADVDQINVAVASAMASLPSRNAAPQAPPQGS